MEETPSGPRPSVRVENEGRRYATFVDPGSEEAVADEQFFAEGEALLRASGLPAYVPEPEGWTVRRGGLTESWSGDGAQSADLVQSVDLEVHDASGSIRIDVEQARRPDPLRAQRHPVWLAESLIDLEHERDGGDWPWERVYAGYEMLWQLQTWPEAQLIVDGALVPARRLQHGELWALVAEVDSRIVTMLGDARVTWPFRLRSVPLAVDLPPSWADDGD